VVGCYPVREVPGQTHCPARDGRGRQAPHAGCSRDRRGIEGARRSSRSVGDAAAPLSTTPGRCRARSASIERSSGDAVVGTGTGCVARLVVCRSWITATGMSPISTSAAERLVTRCWMGGASWSDGSWRPVPGAYRILDVGAGTGIIARAWPSWSPCEVVALEPTRGTASRT
jgi:hypothetical protein